MNRDDANDNDKTQVAGGTGTPSGQGVSSPGSGNRTEAVPSPPLTRWGHLRILERVGSGGFGEVFRAWDESLDREVALKLLHPDVTGVVDLKSEGRLLARLHHPNVMTVYGLTEIEGRTGMWSEFIRGRTLAQVVERQGSFGASEAVSIGKDVCRALTAVHSAGLVHRDIKAQNVMREDGGRIVLMDFGLGMAVHAKRSNEARTVGGTPTYMAPELFDGRNGNVLSDIYSVGVLLFYLVTGKYPVEAKTWEEYQQKHREGSRHLQDLRSDLPEGYVRTVEKALAKKPHERYESAGQLWQALAELSTHDSLIAPVPPPATQRRNVILVVAAAVILLLVIGGVLRFTDWGIAIRRDAAPSIAVLPFANLSPQPENEYLAEGIGEELTNELARSENLRVVARASVASFKGSTQSISEIATKLRVSSVLTGGVRRSGDRIRVSAQLVRASDGTQMWSDVYEHDVKDVFAMQKQISKAVAGALRVRLAAGSAGPALGENAESYDLFLQGRFFLNKGGPVNTAKAIDYFRTAIEQNPNYARAYAGLSLALVRQAVQTVASEQLVKQAKDAANKALTLDNQLALAHLARAFAMETFDWDWKGAEQEFRLAIDCDPKDVDVRLTYAGLLMNMVRTREAWEQLRKAEERDPLSPIVPHFKSVLLFVEGRYAEGRNEIEKVLPNSPESPNVHTAYGIQLIALGRNEDGLRAFRRAAEVSTSPIIRSQLGWALGRTGHPAEARQVLKAVLDLEARGEAAPAQVAQIYIGLNELDEAFQWMDKAVKVHDPGLGVVKIAPMFGGLRKDPRYQLILEQVGLKDSN